MKYDSKFVRHKTNSSLKQIKNYINKNLLKKDIINEKLEMDDEGLIILYKIKFLKEIGFTLDETRIILDNLKEIELLKMFKYFILKEKNLLNDFEKNLVAFSENKKLEINRNTFGYFESETLAKGVMFDLYNYRIEWYKNETFKKELKVIRKNIFTSFSDYIKNKHLENLYLYFESLNVFLKTYIKDYSKLHFFCMIKWWTAEPRYVKQIKNKLNYNYGPDLFNQAVIWITKF
ncbi:hypothetical protein [Spiroplasma tabanidicola]|uniref:Uncharacterized protein n=1 Tax=Spiroplasma tabanidicola TaxID=324079 RepID=A0A6I6C7K7_9MOLU|nr:hypothetical protein [Spiroplasma tabanidicola]QGS51409.1 hypothetical protein STABA_v1c00420 [Spiroplasma tabanidicola]